MRIDSSPISTTHVLDLHASVNPYIRAHADHVEQVAVLRSDDDPLVPLGQTDRLADQLNVVATVVPGARHFLADDGITRPPEAFAAAQASSPV